MGRLLLLLFPFLSLFIVEDVSMEPSLFEEDRIIILKTRRINRDNMVVFLSPDGHLSIKRCLLKEGDLIEIEGNRLIYEKQTWFLQPDQKKRLSQYNRVPEKTYFLVGDNSYHSLDSREWGFISKEDIMGRVIRIKRESH